MNNTLKKIRVTAGFSCFLIFSTLSHAAHHKIYGITGDLKNNVLARLTLIQKNHHELSPTILITNIKKAMAPFGFYSPMITIKKKGIRIKKGPATHINTVQIIIEGEGKEKIDQTFKNEKLIKGAIFNSEHFETVKQDLFNIAERNGYLNARMIDSKVQVYQNTHQADILLSFQTGKQYHFGKINFDEKTAYNPLFLKRYLTFTEGEPFSSEKLLQLTAALNDSVYFKNVVVNPNISKNIDVPVTIYLRDKPAQNYLAGLGYVTDTGVRARLGSQWLRVNDFGHTFQALYVGSQKQNALQAEYVIPGENPTIDQYSFSSKIFQLRYPIGNAQAQQLSAASVFQKNKRLFTISINRLEETFNYMGYDKQTKKILYPSMKIDYKKISSPLFSKQGFSVSGTIKAASKILASNIDIAQIDLTAKAAFWLPTHTRLFFRNHFGLTETPDINALPLSLQLLAGGAESIRGYHYQSIGLGKKINVHSAEIQQETVKNWYLTAFYDIGSVHKPARKSWKRGIGGGLMWVSPIGPIRLSLAKAIDETGTPFRIIFNMGPDL